MKSQKNSSPYFQNQGFFSLRCGLHAVNNFLGKRAYTDKQFSSICNSLEEQSEQKFQHIFGGDYDVSVLIKALYDKGYDIEWHDARKEFTKQSREQEAKRTLEGYLVNVNMEKFYHKLLGVSGRHWVSVKLTKNQKGELVYKMDSKDKHVQTLKEDQLIKYLEEQRRSGAQILKVFPVEDKLKQDKKQELKEDTGNKQESSKKAVQNQSLIREDMQEEEERYID